MYESTIIHFPMTENVLKLVSFITIACKLNYFLHYFESRAVIGNKIFYNWRIEQRCGVKYNLFFVSMWNACVCVSCNKEIVHSVVRAGN